MSELSYQLRKEVKEYNSGFFKGDLNKIRELIKRGANVNDIDEYDRTALHIACYDEKHVPDFDLIETLIRCGGRVDVLNRYGENCLHLICQNQYKDDLIELLLDCGADPNQKDFHGNTPLHVLVENPKQDVSFNTLKIFTKKGADVYALNKLNKNIFVYLEPQMNEDLQFYARRCLVKLNRLKRLLGIDQQQFSEVSNQQSNLGSQNIGLQQNIPPPIQGDLPTPIERDLPKGSNVNTPIPNITPPVNTLGAVPVTNAPLAPNSNESIFTNVPKSPTKEYSSSSESNVPVSYTQQVTTGVENLSLNTNQPGQWTAPQQSGLQSGWTAPNQQQSGIQNQQGWNNPNIPYTQQNPIIEDNPK